MGESVASVLLVGQKHAQPHRRAVGEFFDWRFRFRRRRRGQARGGLGKPALSVIVGDGWKAGWWAEILERHFPPQLPDPDHTIA
ncbi:hypothetical protein ACFCX0_44905 [Streptomyces sp. NPDC056352]|uniref:hypothetical protein n=1 Tax=Streptomyces sp. NPDC056352 TaxID=3345791 RepID=UPI0035D6ABAB